VWRPHWLVDLEVDVLVPKFTRWSTARAFDNFLHQNGPADLDWTVAPVLRFGYVCNQGGTLLASYRYLASDGDSTHGITFPVAFPAMTLLAGQFPVFNPVVPGLRRVHSRLNLHTLDLDYVWPECRPLDRLALQWALGGRFLGSSFEADARDTWAPPPPLPFPTGVAMTGSAVPRATRQKFTNEFFGAGPHAVLDLAWPLGDRGLAVFGRVDGSLLVGGTEQRVREEFAFNVSGFGNEDETEGPMLVPTLSVQVGVRWTIPCDSLLFHLSAGYQYEKYWYVAVGEGSDDAFFHNIDLQTHGLFLRCGMDY
jgi:hypothetical protein